MQYGDNTYMHPAIVLKKANKDGYVEIAHVTHTPVGGGPTREVADFMKGRDPKDSLTGKIHVGPPKMVHESKLKVYKNMNDKDEHGDRKAYTPLDEHNLNNLKAEIGGQLPPDRQSVTYL